MNANAITIKIQYILNNLSFLPDSLCSLANDKYVNGINKPNGASFVSSIYILIILNLKYSDNARINKPTISNK